MFRTSTLKSPAAGAAADQARGFIGRLVATLSAELRTRRGMRMLAGLDERMLRDIGVDRDQIWYAARYGRDSMRRNLDRRTDFPRWQ